MLSQILPTKKNLVHLFKTFFFIVAVKYSAVAQTWSTPIVIAGGINSHLLVVNGNPAIVCYDYVGKTLWYVRANDITGTAWGTPVILDSNGEVGSCNSIQIVNGNPAISYYDGTNNILKYTRAIDASGSAWSTPLTLDVLNTSGIVDPNVSLQIVNGNPAVSYYDKTNAALKFIRSTDASGTKWGTAITIDSGKVSGTGNLQILNGRPAISYYYGEYTMYTPPGYLHKLMFIHASDSSGTSWGSAITLDSNNYIVTPGDLQIVNGKPAIAYSYSAIHDLRYVRATDTSGVNWNTPVFIDNAGAISLHVVNGYPAIAYRGNYFRNPEAPYGNDLKYVHASDADGINWTQPVTIDSIGAVGDYSSLQVVNNNPAISYYDYTNRKIKYVYGTDLLPSQYYYRTRQNGNWNDVTTWESSSNNTDWSPATFTPNFSANAITILNSHNITVTAPVTIDQTTIDAGGTLTVKAGVTLTINDGQGFDLNVNGSLVNNGHLLVKSENTGQSDAGTASVGPVTGTITGTGDVTVERYISAAFARSAWRLLNAPLQTKTGVSNSIYDNWQTMGGAAANTGMTVSGPDYNGGANGLDYLSNAPSMKYWNGSAFVGVTDTKATSLYANPWFTFIRGDRTNTTYGSAGQTKLAATGILNVGSITVPTNASNDAFTFVGNPYASAIDLLTFNTDNSGSNIKSNYYYWDPYLTGEWSVGGYVTVSIDNLNNVIIVPESATSPLGPSTPPGVETRFLQSGQAMVVQTRSAAGGEGASVTFNENQKSYNVANNIFRVTGSQPDKITVNLNVLSAGNPILLDAAVAAFHSSYSALVNDYDAAKLLNTGESISIIKNGKDLSIERRPTITSDDIINLDLTALKLNTTYQLEIKPSVNAAGLNAFLVDNYLKTTTPLDLSQTKTVDFTFNADAASTGANRFYISFAKPAVVSPSRDGISVFPNPITNGIITLQMNNMAAGIYSFRVFNSAGQVIAVKQINHLAGNATEVIYLGKDAAKGIYHLEVMKPDNSKFSSKIVTN